MTEAEHLENMEFIRQASENAKVALVLEEIKTEIYEELKNDEGASYGLGLALGIINKHIADNETKAQ